MFYRTSERDVTNRRPCVASGDVGNRELSWTRRDRIVMLGAMALVIMVSADARHHLRGQEAIAPIAIDVRENVMIPMRDGVALAANIFLPRAEGKYPTILVRTPYGKLPPSADEAKQYVRRGYAMVVQDCRGRGNSQGVWDPFRYDRNDGHDTQAWIVEQSWSDGQLGTSGGSYVGWTQWAAAPQAGPHLKCMVPIVPFADAYHDIAYPGGSMQLSLLMGWGAAVGGIAVAPDQLPAALRHLPLNRWDEQFGKDVFYIDQWVQHPTYDQYWRERGIDGHLEEVTVPILNIGGWYDIFSKTTIDLVDQVRSRSKDRLARQHQHVIMGPWAHGVGARQVGQLDFGPAAQLNLGKVQQQWFDYWLKQQETGVADWPAYYLFVMGENRWRSEHEWPLKRTQFTPYYFHGMGHAATSQGDGVLTQAKPAHEPTDTFAYDPANPVPTVGGNNLVGTTIGPYDQSEVEQRADVLCYTSEPLTAPLEVTGPIRAVLFASSTARSTDFTAKLVDVHPDGKSYLLCDGIRRSDFRQSETTLEPIEPGHVYRYDIDLWVTSNVFLPGHRVRVEISSSNFPRFDRNPNTGAEFGTSEALQAATQTIYHDEAHPSHLVLPVIPRETSTAAQESLGLETQE